MNRQLLLRVAGPSVLIGLLLFGVCLVSAWQVNRLQAELTEILNSNVGSMQAAQQLELSVRQLRFHSFLYVIDPQPVLIHEIERDQEMVEEWINKAQRVSHTPEEAETVAAIRNGFNSFQKEMAQLRLEVGLGGPRRDLVRRAADHPIQHVIDPCRKFALINEEMMNEAARESARVSRWLQGTMFLLGIVGPISGLLSGFGIARGLSRSLYRLSLSVRDMAQNLEKDVAAVRLSPEGDLANLEAQLQHVVVRVAEVGEQLRAQERDMLRAQQLSAVGQLAASVAHEIRNPLTSIKMLVEAALRESRPRPFTPENLRVVHGEIRKLEQTVQEFLDFARPPVLQKVPCDLGEVLRRAVELVRARARQQNVTLEIQAPERPVPSQADPNQLSTVLVNLFINALDAMPTGGRLEAGLEMLPREGVCFYVRDSGPGMPPEVLNQLFIPFVSNKPTGSGLGLSISKRIIEDHGGTLEGKNLARGGAGFRVVLPGGGGGGARVPRRGSAKSPSEVREA